MEIRTSHGTYEFSVMPFGLAGDPATFQRLSQTIPVNELLESLVVHLGDVLVYFKTSEEHTQQLRVVLQKVREHKSFFQLPKCDMVKQGGELPGVCYGPQRVSADAEKVKRSRSGRRSWWHADW